MLQTPQATSTPHVAVPLRKALGQFGWVWGLRDPPQPVPASWWPCVGRAAEYTAPAIRLTTCQGQGLLWTPSHGSARLWGERGAEWGFSSLYRHLPVPCLLPACHVKGLPMPSFAPGTAAHTLLWGSALGQMLQEKVRVPHGD